jgi:hypothetical protein
MHNSNQSPKVISSLIKLLPYICLNYEEANQKLAEFFLKDVKGVLENVGGDRFYFDRFVEMMEICPKSFG